jgi:hypothetical protein
LKTASGNKRATQTTKAAAAKPSGAIAGKVKRNPAAAGKIGQQAKAAAPKAAQAAAKPRVSKLDSRIDPAKQANRKATAAAKPAKAASKVDTSMSGLARRRARANAPRNSTYLSQKLNTRSAITRSAANAIYNEQRKGAKTLFDSKLPTQIAKAGLIGKGLSGSKRERAEANREAARKRVLKGKRR